MSAPVAYVESRTSAARGASGAGLTVWDTSGRAWRLTQTVELEDPTWLHVDAARRRVWAGQGDGGTVSTLAIAEDGTLIPLGAVDVGGSNIVDVAPSPDGAYLLTANHDSGSVSLIRSAVDGAPGRSRACAADAR
jgi:6-phosphogluconolactonase